MPQNPPPRTLTFHESEKLSRETKHRFRRAKCNIREIIVPFIPKSFYLVPHSFQFYENEKIYSFDYDSWRVAVGSCNKEQVL